MTQFDVRFSRVFYLAAYWIQRYALYECLWGFQSSHMQFANQRKPANPLVSLVY